MSLLLALEGAPAPVPQDDDWWAGTMQCFGGLALATSLAGAAFTGRVAAGLQAQDEVLPPSVVAESDAWQIPAPQQGWSYSWLRLDDPAELAPQAMLAAEVEGWAAPALPSGAPGWIQPAPWAFQSDEAFWLGIDDEGWRLPLPAALPGPAVTLWLADQQEVVPQAAAFVGDDDGWQPPQPSLAPAVAPPPWWADAGEIAPQPVVFVADDDGWVPPLVAVAPALRLPPWYGEPQEIVSRVAVDDSGWVLPLPAPWLSVRMVQWVGEDFAGLPMGLLALDVQDRSRAQYMIEDRSTTRW